MKFLVLISLVLIINVAFVENRNPGHLKPFGSVGSLININELDKEYPTVFELFTNYIPKSEPILSRLVLNNDNHYSLWQTDEQLESEVYGLAETEIQVDSFESRRETIHIQFGEFLQRFGKEPLSYTASIPRILQKYLVVPKPLQCETVLETFQSALLMMDGITTLPVQFDETFDHFYCMLRGNKNIILVNGLKHPDIRKIFVPENDQQGRPSINPDSVDLNQFPELSNVDYHSANITSGDCLFIPANWIFHERSLKETIAVLYNIKHRGALKINVNELNTCLAYDEKFTLDQIDWTYVKQPQSVQNIIMNLAKQNDNVFDRWQENFGFDIASDNDVSDIFDELYGLIDVDGDGTITVDEVEQYNVVVGNEKTPHQRHVSDLLYELAIIVNKKRQAKKSKSVDSKDNQLTDDEKQMDEQLHLQNYKTDL